MTSTVTFTTTAPVAPARPSRGSVTTIHTEGDSAVITAANMMMQTERAQRALTTARMNADAKNSEALKSALGEIRKLTDLVTNLTAEVAALKAERTKKNLVQTAMITEVRQQVAAIAADVQNLKKGMEFMKLPLRHYYITVGRLPIDSMGNVLDQHLQMLKPAVVRPPRGIRPSKPEPTELEEFMDYNKPELWRFGYKKKAYDDKLG